VAFKWPRTRYMLISSWTRICFKIRSASPSFFEGFGPKPSAPARTGSERREDLVVEVVLSREALGDEFQEQTGLGALNDAMVVGRRERHHLAHTQFSERARVGRSKPAATRVRRRQKSHPDGHQSWHGLHRARVRVGERHRRADEVVGAETRRVDLSHQVS